MPTLTWKKYDGARIAAPGFRAKISGFVDDNTARYAYLWETDGNWRASVEILKPGQTIDVDLGMRAEKSKAIEDVFAFLVREVAPKTTHRKSPYHDEIVKDLGMYAAQYDPRHIEAYMRLERGTLDGLSRQSWEIELEQARLCIDAGGANQAEELAKSYGL